MLIREETPADLEAIRAVTRLAFQSEDEVGLIDRLREERLVVASLVALERERVVGHILFSTLPVETAQGMVRGASLAPMAVRPDCQRRGIGSALVRRGLDLCRARTVPFVIVLGHPEYYPRFGFDPALTGGLQAPFSGEAFMALELAPGALQGLSGTVRYPEPFGLAK